MNGSALEARLYPLDQETLHLIADYEPFYQVYIDALALIHDLVCEFAAPPQKPRLTPSQINEQRARVVHAPNDGNHNSTAFMKNIEDNFGLAWKLRNRAERSESMEERLEAELMATQFMNSLLETYTTLRILQQHSEPAHL